MFVGRKLASFLQATNFQNVEWNATVHNFNNENDLKEEYKNNQDRIIFAKESLVEVLGGEESYDDFQKLYLEEMKKSGSTIFFNKFIAWGLKGE